MKFLVEIELDNDAFHDEEGRFAPMYEIKRILLESLTAGALAGVMTDINGNFVGQWRIDGGATPSPIELRRRDRYPSSTDIPPYQGNR